MTPSLREVAESKFQKPDGDPDLMTEHARKLRAIAKDLGWQAFAMKQTVLEGAGPVITRANDRAVARHDAMQLRVTQLDDLAKRIEDAIEPLRAEWKLWNEKVNAEILRLSSQTPA